MSKTAINLAEGIQMQIECTISQMCTVIEESPAGEEAKLSIAHDASLADQFKFIIDALDKYGHEEVGFYDYNPSDDWMQTGTLIEEFDDVLHDIDWVLDMGELREASPSLAAFIESIVEPVKSIRLGLGAYD